MEVNRSNYVAIKQILHIPIENNDIEQVIDKLSYSNDEKTILFDKIHDFVNYFLIFKDIAPFMNSLHSCIKKTLEIEVEEINEIDGLLVSNALLKFMLEYVNHCKMNQNDTILNVLADSLEKLEIQPLILNLGILMKPIYGDQVSLDKIKSLTDEEVEYVSGSEYEIDIKQEMDKWLSMQDIRLDNQEELKILLIEEFDRINKIDELGISRESEGYQDLLTDVMEMMALRLTVISLMDSMSEESLEPIPISIK